MAGTLLCWTLLTSPLIAAKICLCRLQLPSSLYICPNMAPPSLWQRLMACYSPWRRVPDEDFIDEKKSQESPKMGTFSGVFIPTTLNVLSILMFLRFGFILGQVGVIGMIGILIISYVIDLLTVLSISAISTNGTVRGGGAYYMISRSLGAEFGGSIGIVFYIGQVLNAGLNVVGFVEPIISNFGNEFGLTSQFLPEGTWFEFLYATCLLLLCTGACLLGSAAFTKAGYVLFVILVLSTLSVPLSAFFVKEHYVPEFDIVYSGLSLQTLRNNTLPMFTAGAAGSDMSGRENFRNIFGIFFPATAGIFAGASMSGDLKSPGRSIPKGTLYGLLTTFLFYAVVIIAMAASIPRQLLYTDVLVLQTVNLSKYVILLGEMSTGLFSAIVGILGAAKVLQAIARDDILPQLRIFKQGTKRGDEPIYAIIFTYLLCQATILLPINQIASFVTMAFLMTFIVTNVACFLLKIGSAPNFRPSFHFFNSITALAGGLFCIATMFVVDGIYASVIIGVLIGLFIIIHYVTPPKTWGDVSQTLIYHQVRKYLLRLRQDHVKFWRPQVLLFVHDPRSSWNLIQFCNSLKKGALYILGHVVVMDDFQAGLVEMKRLQSAWVKLRDISKVKAFIQMAADPDFLWGARNIVMQAGLGGMKPNIAVLGFFDVASYRARVANAGLTPVTTKTESRPELLQHSFKSKVTIDSLPTDNIKPGTSMSVTQYVNIIEDLLAMQINVAIARGFSDLELPYSWIPKESRKKKYIDLWPIQMSAHLLEPNGEGSVLSTNFDTYTLILQLGAILRTVPAWKKIYKTRVVVFVEYQEDVEEERGRVKTLLDNLRIEAEICVFCLSDGSVPAYETLVHGMPDTTGKVTAALGDEAWWIELQHARQVLERADVVERGKPIPINYLNGEIAIAPSALLDVQPANNAGPSVVGSATASGSNAIATGNDVPLLKKYLHKRRQTMTEVQRIGMSFSMQTSRLADEEVAYPSTFDDENVDEDELAGDAEYDEGYLTEDTGVGSSSSRGKGNDLSPTTTSQSKKSLGSSSASSMSTLYDQTSRTSSQSATTRLQEDQQRNLIDIERSAADASSSSSATPSFESQRQSIGGSSTVAVDSQVPLAKPRLTHQSSLATSISGTARTRRSIPHFSGQTMPHSEVLSDEDGQKTIRFASYSGIPSPLMSPAAADNHNPLVVPKSGSSSTLFRTLSTVTAPYHDERYLSFNDLPARAQHLILNDLMGTQSRDAAVLFATLPAPMANTYQSEEESIAYLEELDLWCKDLPPTLLVHSQSVTVTMAL
ncbi:amino acid permease-domain-containing protein [Lipomyces kononenkoae]|uniref:Amino acid permease-domain-containing protein n=1 Tax=Lipomyces kononenkoae TaxID=34357 RepID=A0ACC3T686_LIPKO